MDTPTQIHTHTDTLVADVTQKSCDHNGMKLFQEEGGRGRQSLSCSVLNEVG